MNKYSILILTDDTTHSRHNSMYLIANALYKDPRCNSLFIASRSNKKNTPFFQSKTATIFAHQQEQVISFGQGFFKGKTTQKELSFFDVIIMRVPRPLSDSFLEHLNRSHPLGVFINDPIGIKESSNKLFLLQIPELCPPMQHCTKEQDVIQFSMKFPIVLKPLKSYGGKGIVKIEKNTVYDGSTTFPLNEYLHMIQEELETDGMLAMKFLKNVHHGDKRIIVANGNLLATSLRLPAVGSWLCNVAQGGTSQKTDISPEEKVLIKTLNKRLVKIRVVLYGIDTLVNDHGQRVISEINTMSVGGLAPAKEESDPLIDKKLATALFTYINEIYDK